MDPKLKDFIHTQVSTTCDADPEILTNYVLALLGESKSAADIKLSLKEKLQEFFEDETTGFIDRLYNYLDRNKPAKKDEGRKQATTTRSSNHREAEDEDDEEDDDSSFKHRRHRHDDDQDSSRNNTHPNRQKRRLSYQDDTEGQNKSRRNYRPHRDDPEGSNLVSSSSNYDRRGGGYQNRYNGNNNGRPGWKNSKPMCRDYNEKGYCVRGDLCPYDHGKDTIIYEDKNSLNNQMMPMIPPPNLPFNMPNMFDKDAFSPEKLAMMQAAFPGMMPSPQDFMTMMMQQQQQQQQQHQQHQQQYSRGGGPMRHGRGAGAGVRGRGRGGNGQQMNGDRYNNNNNRQQTQQITTTLVIDNIPPEKCQMVPINDYFKKFGNITNINIQSQKALVQFSTRSEAEAAHASPDVIFDNRFVKVYWYKETSGGDFGQGTGTGGPKSNSDGDDRKWKTQQQRGDDISGSHGSAPPPPPPSANDEPDPSLVAAKAAEFQKLRDAQLKKRQEQMKAVLESQKQKEQLLQQQIDEQKKLMAKITDKSLTQAQKEDLLRSLRKISSDIDTSKATSTQAVAAPPSATFNPESSDYLKNKLATLEVEAASMGISADIVTRSSPYQSVHNGGYYSGGWPPRGGGDGPMMMKRSLDNRPTKVMVKDIPQDTNEEDFKKHFEQFGRMISFEKAENGMVAHYLQRFEAEKAMAMGSKFTSAQLSLSWYTDNQSSSPGI